MLTLKNNLLLTLILLLLFGLLPKLASAQSSETRNLEYFSEVDFEGHGSIYLIKGSENKIELQSSGRIDLADIKTRIEDNTLVISYETDSQFPNLEVLPKINVYLTYTSLESLIVAGKIKVQTQEPITAPEFSLQAEGYITGALEVDVINFDLEAEGYARIKVSGKANTQRIRLEGLGKIRAEELVSKEVDIEIDGSSYISLFVSEALFATVQGQAHLEFSGDPRITEIDKEEQAFVGTF